MKITKGNIFLLQVLILSILVATVDQSKYPLVIQIPFWTLVVYTIIWMVIDTIRTKRRENEHYKNGNKKR